MMAANDIDTSFLQEMAPDQLRLTIAHAAGILAYRVDDEHARMTLQNVARGLAPRDMPVLPCGTVGRETLSAALDTAARAYNVTASQIAGRRKIRAIAHARQYAMWLLRQHKLASGAPKFSFPAIAAALGLKDHSTVHHGVRAHEARMQQGRAA